MPQPPGQLLVCVEEFWPVDSMPAHALQKLPAQLHFIEGILIRLPELTALCGISPDHCKQLMDTLLHELHSGFRPEEFRGGWRRTGIEGLSYSREMHFCVPHPG